MPSLLRPRLLLPLLIGLPFASSVVAAAQPQTVLVAAAAAAVDCPDTHQPPKASRTRPPATPAPREPRSPSCVHCRAPMLDAPLA